MLVGHTSLLYVDDFEDGLNSRNVINVMSDQMHWCEACGFLLSSQVKRTRLDHLTGKSDHTILQSFGKNRVPFPVGLVEPDVAALLLYILGTTIPA